MRLTIETAIECDEWNKLDVDAVISDCLNAALQEMAATPVEGAAISFLFCDDSRIHDLNRMYRGQNKPTNVLSFPAPPHNPAFLLGDIALAYETIAREAREQGKSLDQHSRHMIVHGFLHLLGYDHEEAKDADVMEALEIRILQKLGIENPYCQDGRSETEAHGRV